MKNKNLIIDKIENLEGKFTQLKWGTQNNFTLSKFLEVLTQSEELLNEVKELIEREPYNSYTVN